MTHVELAPEVAEDFERILDHLDCHQAAHPEACIREIIAAFDVLEHSPLIGRPADNGKGELLISRHSRKSHGYVALYRHVEEIDIAFILAIRSQRETGYTRDVEAGPT